MGCTLKNSNIQSLPDINPEIAFFEIHISDLKSLDSAMQKHELKYIIDFKSEKISDLGFGYSVVEMGIGFYNFTLRIFSLTNGEQEVLSTMYEIIASHDSNTSSQNLIDSLIRRGFKVNEYGEIKKYSNFKKSVCFISKTLQYELIPQIDTLVSPWSGLIYGQYCGFGGRELSNRKKFKQLGMLNNETIKVLLNSINPATRLMTIEYLFNEQNYVNQKIYYSDVQKILQQPILMQICEGDISSYGTQIEALRLYCKAIPVFNETIVK